ncbi:MAG: type II toxin-antitoxin system VapC family toxin [Acidobacteriia bacterium]|nr:type II toxin-antitoxin system VapC family toxin [Terriglobia bacterium]
MNPRFLLDTHIVVRWLSDLKKLSREQRRVLDDVVRHGMHAGVSAMSLVEIAFLGEGRPRLLVGVNDLLHQLDTNPTFRIIPITPEIAQQASALSGSLRDPADCMIVATARIHRLTLLTSDQRIVESGLVPVVA